MVSLPSSARPTYRLFVVKPTAGFTPQDWRQRPDRFTIVKRLETTNRVGKADALKWLHNHDKLNGPIDVWVVSLPPQKSSKSGRYCPACLAAA